MYNKLFTKILDSSIWLAPDPHRLVWITLIAAMDEDGNAMFASAGNLAARARVSREQAESAIAAFEAPDLDSADQDNEGRRVERFPGGWHILNAAKYRALVTKAIIRDQTRERVARYRERNSAVTQAKRNANSPVTPSVSEALALSEARALAESKTEAIADATPALRSGVDAAAKASANTRGTRLPDGWVLPKAWGDWALTEMPGWTADAVRLESDRFRDHWRSKAGKDAVKLDWQATWRNWCRNARVGTSGSTYRGLPTAQTKPDRSAHDAEAKRLLFGAKG